MDFATPQGALIAPALGADPQVGMAQAVGALIQKVGQQQHQLMSATVLAVSSNAAQATIIAVGLDTAPSEGLQAHTMNGWVPPVGARVMCLLYPPRGLLVLGQIDNARMTTYSSTNYTALQTFVGNVPAGTIYLNNGGGGVVSTPMRPIFRHDTSGSQFSTTNAAFTALGTTNADVTIPYPSSGCISITLGGDLQMTTANQFALASFEMRNLNSTGTVLFTASDSFSASIDPGVATVGRISMAGSFTLNVGIDFTAPASGTIYIRPMLRSTTGTASWGRPSLLVRPEL
jgi:hypothetical protein